MILYTYSQEICWVVKICIFVTHITQNCQTFTIQTEGDKGSIVTLSLCKQRVRKVHLSPFHCTNTGYERFNCHPVTVHNQGEKESFQTWNVQYVLYVGYSNCSDPGRPGPGNDNRILGPGKGSLLLGPGKGSLLLGPGKGSLLLPSHTHFMFKPTVKYLTRSFRPAYIL